MSEEEQPEPSSPEDADPAAAGETAPDAAQRRDQAVAWFLAQLASTPDEPDEDLVGARIGRFEIQRSLHASTFGTMYEAKDMESGERVALRVVTPQTVPDEERRAQVRAAAESAAGLSHANLAAVREVIEEDDRLGIVSDLVEGLRLSDRLSSVQQMALPEAQTVARGVARALAAAHEHGIAHLDVEPGNVLMSHTGVKLLDVGLGQAAGATLRGAPRYASPEATRGEPCDARSDVFSFGVLLYELLTGESPFEADDVERAIERVREDDPRPVTHVRAEVPERLSAVVDRCLRKAPADRYANAVALVAALEEAAPAPLPPGEPVRSRGEEEQGHTAGARPPARAPEAALVPSPPRFEDRPWLEIAAFLALLAALLAQMGGHG